MEKIIAFGLILLGSSISGDDVCVRINHEEDQHCSKFENLNRAIIFEYPIIWDLKLQIKSNNNLTIAPYAFENSHIRSLYMEGLEDDNKLQKPTALLSLLQDSFAGMSKLRILVFHCIGLNFNNENPLAPLGSLVRLVIRDSNLTEVPTQMLVSVPKLEDLDLVGNQITVVRSNILVSLKTLQTLDLSENRIDCIESGAFNGLSRLTHLMLKGNHFGDVSMGLFDGLTSLTYLGLEDCNITRIAPGAFGRLTLDWLDLRWNKIKVIETETFSGLFVKKLLLDHNEIKELEPRAFRGSIVQKLDLTGNQLTRIDVDDFEGFTTRYLGLGHNKIQNITAHALRNVATRRLDLYNNSMGSVSRAELGLLKSVELPTKGDGDIYTFRKL